MCLRLAVGVKLFGKPGQEPLLLAGTEGLLLVGRFVPVPVLQELEYLAEETPEICGVGVRTLKDDCSELLLPK